MSEKAISKRDELRTAILGVSYKPTTREVTLCGQTIELRPLKLRQNTGDDTTDTGVIMARSLILMAYVPGTEERVFEEGDQEAILNLYRTPELFAVIVAMGELNGGTSEDTEKN